MALGMLMDSSSKSTLMKCFHEFLGELVDQGLHISKLMMKCVSEEGGLILWDLCLRAFCRNIKKNSKAPESPYVLFF